jgi:hypothetical protein
MLNFASQNVTAIKKGRNKLAPARYCKILSKKKLTSNDKLPQVFPMVIYTESKLWTASLGGEKLLSLERFTF